MVDNPACASFVQQTTVLYNNKHNMAKQSLSQQVQTALGLSIWLAGHMVVVLLAVITLLGLPAAWAVALLALQVGEVPQAGTPSPPRLCKRHVGRQRTAAHHYY